MIKKVVLINPVNYGRDAFRPPFGLLTIASVFAAKGVEVKWIDADALRDQKEQIEREITKNLDADLIATGGLHNAYRFVKEIFEFFDKKNITIPKLVGGKLAQTLDHLIWTKVPGVDMLCKQEGEYVIESLCEHFPALERIQGIEYLKNGQIVKNKPAPLIKSLDETPPLRWDILDENTYLSSGTGYILSSRGCPYACRFCKYPDPLSKNYRTLSAGRILEDIQYLINRYKIHTICFIDEFFLLQKSRVEKFCDAIESRHLNIKWVISSRADAIKAKDTPLLKRMRMLGCSHINMGIESGSQTMLNSMGKELKVEQIETALNVICEAGIKLKPSFIFGFPGETPETVLESVRWRLRNELLGLYNVNKKGKYFYATPYPGAPLYDRFIKKYNMSLEKEERWILKCSSLKKPTVNLTDMTEEQLTALDNECRDMLKNHRRFIRGLVNKNLSRKNLYLIHKLTNKLRKFFNGQ
jgi:radical SAM superfamily enzyme YgiQ (UPF0313 family)